MNPLLTTFAVNMEQGRLCKAVFLDLAKAFGTMDCGNLLSKLSAIGLFGNSLQWFRSYVTERKQRTSCEMSCPANYQSPMGSSGQFTRTPFYHLYQ